MTEPPQVVFCDLDGTLTLDNSFHVFLAAAWTEANTVGRLTLALTLVPRVFGSIAGGHRGMKLRVLVWFWRQELGVREAIVDRTTSKMLRTLSQPIVALLRNARQEGAKIVISTAAPDIYAFRLLALVGAEACLATPGRPGPQWNELLGETKATACQRWLDENPPPVGAYKVTVVTDHPDDLPLLRLADRAVIQGSPNALDELENAIRLQAPAASKEVRRIDLLSAQGLGGGYWLWFDDRPEGPLDRWEIKTILSKHRYAHLYVGNGEWRRIGPGQALTGAVLRQDCPRPPSSRMRLAIHVHRRVVRDLLGWYH